MNFWCMQIKLKSKHKGIHWCVKQAKHKTKLLVSDETKMRVMHGETWHVRGTLLIKIEEWIKRYLEMHGKDIMSWFTSKTKLWKA